MYTDIFTAGYFELLAVAHTLSHAGHLCPH